MSAEATLRNLLRQDLDFHGGDSVAAHSWHPFPAKFPPKLPRYLIEHLTAPGDAVLDPMFGSGTTVLEAARLRRCAIGCDIDPLARLMATAKLAPLDRAQALDVGHEVVAQARHLLAAPDGLREALGKRFRGKTREFVDYWFLPQQQLELAALLAAIDFGASAALRPFLHMIFSSTIIAKSGGASLARDLAHTRPHRVQGKKPVSAIATFAKRLQATLSSDIALPDGANADIRDRSAAATGLPAASVDLIVTSPPYANNAIDYMRAHKFSLVWLGWEVEELRRIRARYLGHDAGADRERPALPNCCEETMARLAHADQRKAAALGRYFGEMAAVLAEMHRVLKPGGAAVIVVGSSNLRGIDVRTHKALAAIGESRGFRLAHIGTRRLDRDRRMMPARWRSGGAAQASQIEQRMHEEHVIGLIR